MDLSTGMTLLSSTRDRTGNQSHYSENICNECKGREQRLGIRTLEEQSLEIRTLKELSPKDGIENSKWNFLAREYISS